MLPTTLMWTISATGFAASVLFPSNLFSTLLSMNFQKHLSNDVSFCLKSSIRIKSRFLKDAYKSPTGSDPVLLHLQAHLSQLQPCPTAFSARMLRFLLPLSLHFSSYPFQLGAPTPTLAPFPLAGNSHLYFGLCTTSISLGIPLLTSKLAQIPLPCEPTASWRALSEFKLDTYSHSVNICWMNEWKKARRKTS